MEKENLHEGHRNRLRKRAAEYGLNTFNDHQVLELMLSYVLPRIDTNPIAHRLIKEFGSFAGVLDAKQADLVKVKGIGEKAAIFLHLLPQVFQTYTKDQMKEGVLISSPLQVLNYLGDSVKYISHEEFYMICLDSKGKVIICKLIAKGSHNQVNFNLKEITQLALQTSASGIILVHNHPTGSAQPSAEDISLTKKIYMSLCLNGIYMLDHLVISKNDYYSFNKNGLFNSFKHDFGKMLNLEALRQKAPRYDI